MAEQYICPLHRTLNNELSRIGAAPLTSGDARAVEALLNQFGGSITEIRLATSEETRLASMPFPQPQTHPEPSIGPEQYQHPRTRLF